MTDSPPLVRHSESHRSTDLDDRGYKVHYTIHFFFVEVKMIQLPGPRGISHDLGKLSNGAEGQEVFQI